MESAITRHLISNTNMQGLFIPRNNSGAMYFTNEPMMSRDLTKTNIFNLIQAVLRDALYQALLYPIRVTILRYGLQSSMVRIEKEL
jgi:hypothetical protein